jgi:serine/threonine protein kinase
VTAQAAHGSAATIAATPRPPTAANTVKRPVIRDEITSPSTGRAVSVGLSDRTVEQLSRQSTAPKWEATEASAGHAKLGGYEIIKTLGEGGMGKVYLANQTSLARPVALKVLSPRLASDAQFVSRFTREAFAAAQLSHHNVVQIHDIGVDRSKDNVDTNFFSMELVDGQSLGSLVSLAGKLDPETAVGYALQAARGLKFAHDHGLIHRDVKPDNLLLNGQGVVKVADLGLVKRSGVSDPVAAAAATLSPAQAVAAEQGKTLPSAIMGTPAYMPPEQARDAGAVDARADVYSLGCTLYHLLTGRAPFAARGVEAMLAAHASETVVPPDRLVKNVAPVLSAIVVKMLAKRPEDRYANMGEVVAALEQCLGIESEKPFTPPQEPLKVLEVSAELFNSSPWKTTRMYLIRGYFAGSAMAVVALAALGHPLIAAGLFGYVLTTVVSYQIIFGLARRTYLMSKLRGLMFGSNFADWASYVLFAVLGVGLLIVFGLVWIWLGFSVAAVLSALAFYGIVDKQLALERQTALEQTERMLKTLRSQGTDENTLRHFVCRYCGRDWEEFYEALFGFESKLQAREAWNRGELGRTRPRYAAWREPIIAWIDRHAEAKREERHRKLLLRVESASLQAKGVSPYEANIQARQTANRLMDNAAAIRAVALKRSTDVTKGDADGRARSGHNAESIPNDWMYEGTHYKARRRRHGNYFERRYGSPFDILVGRSVRLVAAMLIMTGFGLWWSNNGAQDARNKAAALIQAREDATVTARDTVKQAVTVTRVFHFTNGGSERLRINHLPNWLCDAIGCWDGAIAGLLLLFSVFFAGRLMGFMVMLASATALLGRHVPLPIGAEYEWLVPAAAVGLWLIAVLFMRDAAAD